jgi:adenylate cyclase class 2
MRSASKTALRKSGRGARRRAGTEIEVKLPVADRRQLLQRLARLKAKLIVPRVHEMNTLYDTSNGNLARHGQMLRLRVERPAARRSGAGKARKTGKQRPAISALLTFKGPAKGAKAKQASRYKVREEHELRIADHEELPTILEALGLRPWFRYEKFRSTFRLPGMKNLDVALDETPIGLFVELEGARGLINRAAGLLGFHGSDYIRKSYGALFMEARGRSGARGRDSHAEPTPFSGLPDMLFPRSK